jgi:hypothetical protein
MLASVKEINNSEVYEDALLAPQRALFLLVVCLTTSNPWDYIN